MTAAVASTAKPAFLCGLIGSGIQASRTPPMHEREGDEQGFRLLYETIDSSAPDLGADALPDLITAAERMGFAGVKATHPCKQAVIPLLHGLSPDAEALGAVNTVVPRDGRRIGHNTGWWGYAESFRRTMTDAPRRRVVQFGAGGAGSAVAYALITLGVEHLTVVDVERSRAEAVAAGRRARFGPDRAAAGCRTLDGGGMAVFQVFGLPLSGMAIGSCRRRSTCWTCCWANCGACCPMPPGRRPASARTRRA